MRYLCILSLLFVVSCSSDSNSDNEIESKAKVVTPRFSKNDCIFGGKGGDASKRNAADEGYKIVMVDVERNQYLLKCLTMKCTGGLRTDWITELDDFMLKVSCSEVEALTQEE